MDFGKIFFWVFIAFVVFMVFKCIHIVPQGYCWITEFLGKYKSTWNAGLHLKIPFLERISNKVVMKERTLDYEPQAVITQDNVMLKVDAVIFLQAIDPKLYTYGVEDAMLALKNLTSTTLRNVIGELEFDEILAARDSINERMTVTLDSATDPWGIKVTRVEIKGIMPPEDIREAMTKQMKAERERRETVLEAEAHQKAVVTRAEGDKQAAILKAEAERDAKIARAEGEAKSIALVYEAEAVGLQRLCETNLTSQVLSLKSLEALKEVANGNSTKIFMPTELASVASLAGVLGEVSGIGSAMPTNEKPKQVVRQQDDCCDDDHLSDITKQIVADYEQRKQSDVSEADDHSSTTTK